MPRRLGVLLNPTSGRGRVARHCDDVLRGLARRGDRVVVIEEPTAAAARAALATALADGLDAVVAVGGDGTVHMALQAVAGTDVALGIVPMGSGNDAARSLGIPQHPARALGTVLDGVAVAVDTGTVTAPDATLTHFLCILTTGFDSLVNDRANRMTWPPGQSRYVVAMLAELRTFRPRAYRMVVDGEQRDEPAMIVSLGNGPAYGGGMRLCPTADLHDGLLSMVWMSPLSRPALLRAFPRVYAGTHLAHPAIHERSVREVVLDAPGLVAYADGERIGPLPVTVRAAPGAVRVLVPADR